MSFKVSAPSTIAAGVLSATLLSFHPALAQFSQQGPKLAAGGEQGAQQGFSASLSSDGNTAIVGGYRVNGEVGAAWVWIRSGQVWTQSARLVGTGAVRSARQGISVALSADGNTAIVGGYFDDNRVGAAWVWTRSGGLWSQQGPKLVGSGAVGRPQQGQQVSISADGNTAIVGGPTDDNYAGAAWIWTRSGGVWTQQGPKLVGLGAIGSSQQGSVFLSADGNTAIVGGNADDGSIGAAWVWTRSGGVWTQEGAKLVGSGAVGNASQGGSVSLSADGNTAMVGGPNDDSATGAVWIWTRSGGVWTQQGSKLVGSGAAGPALQGNSVSLSADGNTAVVGAPFDDDRAGAAWVWTRRNGVWSQLSGKLVGSGAVGQSEQGNSVSLSADGRTAIAGGGSDNAMTGAAWVYTAPGQAAPACVQDATTLCLSDHRFAVSAAWQTGDGKSGQGQAVPLTADTGYFTFFSAANVEVVVKVLNACGLNSKYWVFAGGLTNVHVVLTVRDTVTGATRTYTTPQGSAFQPIQDTSAFATCPATGSPLLDPSAAAYPSEPMSVQAVPAVLAPTSACTQDSATICLSGDRFAVTAMWRTDDGKSGQGQAVRLTADTGYFTFFNPANVEVIVKVLNACDLNATSWVFAGGLTNVHVEMTVRDTATGIIRTYTNPLGTAFQPLQDTSAFATCGGVLDSASALVRSSTGGTITLSGGATVSIAAGLLQSDANVSVSVLPTPPRQPGGSIAAVGSPVCVALTPATRRSPFAPAASPATTGIEVVLDLSRDSASEVTGAVPFSELMVPSLPPDSRDVFLGVPGSVDAVKRTATVGFSKPLLDWFEVTRSGSTATLCAELANWRAGSSAPTLRTLVPLESLPALLRFDGVTWAPAGPFELKDPGRTCVMVHGIFGSVEKAFPASDCMRRIQARNGCDTVLGFNYRWWDQSIEESATQLVNALAGRGLHNVVIEGHSLGGVVAMTAIPRLRLSGLTIDHFVTLGSPMSGTPVVSNAENFVTRLAYEPLLPPVLTIPLLALNTWVNGIPIKDQLIPGSRFLTDARAAYMASTPGIPWTAAAGNQPEYSARLSDFLCGHVACDGVVPVASSLARDWPVSAIHGLPEFPTNHTGIECCEDVINAVGNDVNPNVPQSGVLSVVPDKLAFSMTAGGFVPSPLAFTITNSSQQRNSRLTYSVTHTEAWLDLDGPLITLGPGESTIFNASIRPAGTATLGAGTYTGLITVADTTPSTIKTVPPLTASPSRTIAVTLVITGQSAAPTVSSFTASPSTIARGQSSTLNWTTTNATSLSISGVGAVQPPAGGSVSVSPTATTAYVLTATGPGGTASANATVTVNAVSTFTLTIARTGTGSGTVTSSPSGIACGATCSAGFAGGASVTLTAIPATGSAFSSWSGGGCSGTGSCVVPMNSNQAVTAAFQSTAAVGTFDGTYDFTFTIIHVRTPETYVLPRYFIVTHGVISTNPPELTGSVLDSSGNVRFSGLCPVNSSGAVFTGILNGGHPKSGQGSWQCGDGITNTWRVDNGG